MKMKNLLLPFMFIISLGLYAQAPEGWYIDELNDDDCDVALDGWRISQGEQALKVYVNNDEVPYLVSDNFNVNEGDSYDFSVDIYNNDDRDSIRVYCDFYDDGGDDIYGEDPVSITDMEGWQTVSWSATVPSGAVEGYILIKFYGDDGLSETIHAWVDNAHFDVDDENLVTNPGFEFWGEGGSPENVANLKTLRMAPTDDGSVYKVLNEAILTYQQSFRNQKWLQDEYGAGMMIDDDAGVITTEYEMNDGIYGLTGELIDYYGTLELIPTEDPGEATSTGNTVEPLEVSPMDSTDFAQHQSMLIKLNNAVFEDSDGTTTFEAGSNYPLLFIVKEHGDFRTHFYDADYIGDVIPIEPHDITGISILNYDMYYIAARQASDMQLATGTARKILENVKLLSNPVTNKLRLANTDKVRQVTVTNPLGQEVLAKEFEGKARIALPATGWKKGVYFVTLTNHRQQEQTVKVVKR